jgi:hypothetical protein
MQSGGALGVAFLRAGALAAAAGLVHVRTRRLGGTRGTALAATAIAAAALLGFPGERPQVIAFVLAGAAVLLAEEWERGGRWWTLAGLAAVGIAWVNVHGSALIGVAVLGATAAVEAVRAAAGARETAVRRTALSATVLAAVTFLSPSGLTTYRYVLQTQGGVLAGRTTEYVSSLRVFSVAGWAPEALVVGFFLLVAVGLPLLARAAPRRAIATVSLLAASAVSYRYHAFLVLLATPWLAVALWESPDGPLRRSRLVAGAAACALAVAIVAATGGPLRALRESVAAPRVPAAAVERLRAAGVEGRALVGFDWSGYVLWEAWPKVVPLVDPRMLDDAALGPYTHMIWATPEGLALLDRSAIAAVLLPFRSPTGDVYTLHGVLRARPDWAVEYVWPGGTLYRRIR